MVSLLVGELEEYLLSLRVLEALAVLLEEAMRAPLAPDADHQGLLIVHAAHQAFGSFGEQSVGGALEEQERGARFELRVAAEQLTVARLELAEMLLLLEREILEDLPAADVARHARGARVELETAPLGGNGDPQGVAREHQVGVADRRRGGRTPRAALFARPVNLDDALGGGEAARGRHLLDERFDVGAQELERAMTGLADEMKMARLPVRLLEPEPALAKVDLARDPRVNHPLQGAVDGCAADALILAPDQIDEIVGAEVSLLTQEDVDDLLALARALAARRLQPAEIRKRLCHGGAQALNDEPQPQVEVAFGFLIVKPPPVTVSTKSTSAPFR
jgi:hypothetical protein